MNKFNELINWFENKGSVIVALSGGVDSALVACAAFKKLKDSALAITANYKTLSQEELVSSKKICSEIGIYQIIINYDELSNENFVKNDNKRCLYCRTELAQYLQDFAKKNNVKTIVDGTNLDDLKDYRPGIVAMHDNGITSPLVDTKYTKNEIRNQAKSLGLSVYDRPSNSCLASRIPWGQRVTAERLARIEVGETIVKQLTGVQQVRVRDLDGLAKIEVEQDKIQWIFNKKTINEIHIKLQQIGFKNVVVDSEGYSPGKINVIAD